MTARSEVIKLMEHVLDSEMEILLEVIWRFIPAPDDIANPEDIAECEQAMREYKAGNLVAHEDIDWS